MIKLIDILNELSINNPADITPEKVYNYFLKNIFSNDNQFHTENKGWKEYKKLRKRFYTYIENEGVGTDILIQSLSKSDLNRFYHEMRELVLKHVETEILNELSINNPITITKYNTKNISTYEYIGGNESLDEFIGQPGTKFYGLKIFNKYLWAISPYITSDNGVDNPEFENKYLVYNIKYFKNLYKPNTWYPDGEYDLDPPITLQNIKILGKE